MLAGEQVPAEEWFAVFKGLMSLVRRVAPADVLPLVGLPSAAVEAWQADNCEGHGKPNRRWRLIPDSPELAGALLGLAHPILTADSEAELFAAISPLVVAIDEQRTHINSSPRPRQLPPLLRQALLRAPSRRGGSMRTQMMLHHEPRLVRRGMRACHVPQHPDRDDVVELIRPYLPTNGTGRGPDRHVPQRLTALALIMLVTEERECRGWNKAARLLGLNLEAVPAMKWPVPDPCGLRTALCVLAERLIDRGLVDYQRRRVAPVGSPARTR